MPVSHIEHFLVAADDIDATRDWYARVLGMKPGPHPDFGFPVHWMYLGDTDIVHIGHRPTLDAGTLEKGENPLQPAPRERPGAVPAVSLRSERHQDRAQLRRAGGRGPGARADGL